MKGRYKVDGNGDALENRKRKERNRQPAGKKDTNKKIAVDGELYEPATKPPNLYSTQNMICSAERNSDQRSRRLASIIAKKSVMVE